MRIHYILTLILRVDNGNHFSSIKAEKQAYFKGKANRQFQITACGKKGPSFFFSQGQGQRMWLPLSLSPDTRGGTHKAAMTDATLASLVSRW